jgi:hypothetical protein
MTTARVAPGRPDLGKIKEWALALLKNPGEVVETFPATRDLRLALGLALQEVDALRALLRVAEKIDRYRERRRAVGLEKGPQRLHSGEEGWEMAAAQPR